MRHGLELIGEMYPGLPEKHRAVLAEVVEGVSVAAAAETSGITDSGVKQRRALAYREIGVQDSHDLLVRAVRHLW